MTRTVATLYIDPRGPYPSMPGVDCWDEARDARLYNGPYPVVAHPPCGPWSKLRQLHRGDDHALAFRALVQVRRCGSILEHPAHSTFFRAAGLPRPGDPADEHGGTAIEVCQVDWGHPARKRTWLYCVGVNVAALRFPEPREPTHWCSGSRAAPRGPVPPGIKVCSAQQRRRTPPAFAQWLVDAARTVGKQP